VAPANDIRQRVPHTASRGAEPTLIRKDNSYSSVSVRNAKFDLMSPIEKEAA